MKERCGHWFLTWKQNSWSPHTLKIALVYTKHGDNVNKALSFLSTPPIPTIHGLCFSNVPTMQLLCGHFTKDLEKLWAHFVFHSRPKKYWVCNSDAGTLKHVISAFLSRTWLRTHSQPFQSYFWACSPTPLAVVNKKTPKLQIVSPAAEILPKPPPVALHTQIGICAAYT